MYPSPNPLPCLRKEGGLFDGPIHDESVDYDKYRDSELEDLGIRILRINNILITGSPSLRSREGAGGWVHVVSIE